MPKVELFLPFEVVGRVLGGIGHGVAEGVRVIADAVTPDAPQPEVLPQGVEVLPDQPPPEELPQPARLLRSYIVQDGEYLVDIASRELGRADRWPEIMALNNLADSRKIRAGQEILLPSV